MSAQKQPSLQSILKRRQQEEFIGREEQINLFRQNLMYSLDDERRRFIFSISGQGGVGKSTLLRLFSKIAADARANVAWLNETIEDMPAAIAHLAKQLEGHDHTFSTFNDRYHIYLKHLHELETDPDAPEGSVGLVSSFLTKVGIQLGRRIPVAGAVLDSIDENDLATQASKWAEFVKRKLTNKDDLHLVQKPVDILTPLFIEGLRKETEKHCVVLFLDTYEYIGGYLDRWLRMFLEGFYGDIPSNIIIVIAGRDELDKNLWIMYEGIIARFNLEPFTELEARKYLAHKGILEERTIEVILYLSGRFPLLVATLASESPSNPDQVGDPSGTAIERFLKWENNLSKKQALKDLAIPRFLNRDIVALVTGEEDAEDFFAWLKKKPFIEQRGKGWFYHEIVRTQMLRYKFHESPQDWFAQHGRLAEYYEQLINSLNLNKQTGYKIQLKNSLLIEAFYHRICQSPQNEMTILLVKLNEAMQTDISAVYSTARQAMEDCMAEDAFKQNLEESAKILSDLDCTWDEIIEKFRITIASFNSNATNEEIRKLFKDLDDLMREAHQLDERLKVYALDKDWHPFMEVLAELEENLQVLRREAPAGLFDGESGTNRQL